MTYDQNLNVKLIHNLNQDIEVIQFLRQLCKTMLFINFS